MAGKTPGQVIEAAREPCAPADILLYDEFAGDVHAYSTHLPLFYFSKQVASADAGAINSHMPGNAQAQRDAWKEWHGTYGEKLRHLIAAIRRMLLGEESPGLE
jgi:hypothetical protein